jgi:hypothetical protein
MKLEFSRQIFKKILNYKILWKSVQWEPSFFRADGRTDITKQIVAFPRNAKSDCQLLASKAWFYNLGFPKVYDILNLSKHKFHVTYLLIFTFGRAANGDCVHFEEQPAVAV